MQSSVQVEWPEFAASLSDMMKDDEADETTYKETFRVFSKDDEGKTKWYLWDHL